MSTLDSFLPYVRPWAPGVPDQVAYKNIRLAVIEFCERTRLWKFEDDFDVTVEDCNSGIFTPGESILHDIEVVMFDGQELIPSTPRDLDRTEKGWRTGDLGTGLPRYYTQIEQNTLRIVPAMEGHVYLCLRLKPSQAAKNVPDFIANEYSELIGWGALSRILTLPNQPYTAPDLAQFYAAKFTDRLDHLSIKSSRGQQNAPKRTRSTYF